MVLNSNQTRPRSSIALHHSFTYSCFVFPCCLFPEITMGETKNKPKKKTSTPAVLSIEYTRLLYTCCGFIVNLYATSGCLKALDVFKDLFQQSLRVSIVYKVQETPPPTPPTPTGLYIRNDSVLHNERICGKKNPRLWLDACIYNTGSRVRKRL